MAHRLVAQSFLRYPVSTILGNEGQIRVLRELSRHERGLSIRTLSNQTALTRQEVKDILATLVANGAVSMVRGGRVMLFRMGDHPIMRAVRELFATEERIYTEVMDCLRACMSAHQGVLAAWVYGSAARGQGRSGNDINVIIVVADADVEAIAGDVRHILAESSHRLPCAPSLVALGASDVIRLSAGDPWWSDLVKDAVPLKGDRPEIYARRLRQAQPSPKAKTFGEALNEIGFVPLTPPRRITLRRMGRARRLTRWRKPEEQN
ncbi:hypothetical protein [Microvirga sp. 2TAF3]|uniref:hypothetical protein n=1 Tax=Microvirga sp. 2TAF3 TaxID=3233014 RepID=UPI003F98D9D8